MQDGKCAHDDPHHNDRAQAVKPSIKRLIAPAVRNVEYFDRRRVALGAIGIVGFPLYYWIWHDVFPQPYENLPLRLIGSLLCVPLVLSRHWPARLRRYLPHVWYFALLYALPFFFSFMLLKNEGSGVWIASALVALFAMVLMLDWLTLLVQFVVGCGLGWLAYTATTDTPASGGGDLAYLAVFGFALVLGMAANYANERVRTEQERAMLATAGSIAHELRTPLLGIRAGAEGVRDYLPVLLDAYELARQHGLPVTALRGAHLDAMSGVLDRIAAEARHANAIIDMLLVNVRHGEDVSPQRLPCSIAHCVETALARYPFSETERPLVAWPRRDDFVFQGVELLTVHMLFNLIKNALRQIARSKTGSIEIATIAAPRSNRLVVRDTAGGISAVDLPHVFTRFYTSAGSDGVLGTGIGLAFCRDVMHTFGGSIECSSGPGQPTEFVMSFPAP